MVAKTKKSARANAIADELICRVLMNDFGHNYLCDAVKIDISSKELLHDSEIVIYKRGLIGAQVAAVALWFLHPAVFITYGHSVMLLHFIQGPFFDVYSFAYSSTSGMFSFYPTCTNFGINNVEPLKSFEHRKFDGAIKLIAAGEDENAGAERFVQSRVIKYLHAARLDVEHAVRAG